MAIEPVQGIERNAKLKRLVFAWANIVGCVKGCHHFRLPAQFAHPAVNPAMIAKIFHVLHVNRNDKRIPNFRIARYRNEILGPKSNDAVVLLYKVHGRGAKECGDKSVRGTLVQLL